MGNGENFPYSLFGYSLFGYSLISILKKLLGGEKRKKWKTKEKVKVIVV